MKETNDESCYVTVCALCNGRIELLKDPEGKVYHGDCWNKLNKQIGEK